MTAGSALAAAALVGVAEAPSYGWFLAAWLIAGVAMAGVFYPPAFAALTGWYGPKRLPALTTLTLAVGFASTIFAPLTAALADQLNWRDVYPTTLAAWAIGLGGVGQVAGRLCYQPLAGRLTVRGRTAAVIGAGGLATLILGLLPGPAFALVAVAVIVGASRGMFTLVEATLVADLWGAERFARLNGTFNAPLTAATALAPSIGAALAATGSYPLRFVALAAAGALGAALAVAATTATPRPSVAVPAELGQEGVTPDGHTATA